MHIIEHLKRLPSHLQQTPDYRTLVALVREENITTATQFRKYLSSSIKKEKEQLTSLETLSTGNRKRAVIARKLEFLRTVEEKILDYL